MNKTVSAIPLSAQQQRFWVLEQIERSRAARKIPASCVSPAVWTGLPREEPRRDVNSPEMGWGERATGGVDVQVVPIGHVEMLREPYVQILAHRLAECLQKQFSATPADTPDRPVQACMTASSEKRQASRVTYFWRMGLNEQPWETEWVPRMVTKLRGGHLIDCRAVAAGLWK
jgi:hypothetical protein